MGSNGFGRFKQSIVIHVAHQDAEAFSQRLGAPSHSLPDDPAKASIIWTRLSNRCGDDDDVVFELFALLEELVDREWRVDWQASVY